MPDLQNMIVWRIGPVRETANCRRICEFNKSPVIFNFHCEVSGFRTPNNICVCHCQPSFYADFKRDLFKTQFSGVH